MKSLWCAVLLFAASVCEAATVEHVRGDLRFSTGDAPAFVARRDLPARWDAKAPGADDRRWRYWLYDVQSDRRAGRDQVYVEHVFEPKSPSLIGEAGRFQINFNPEFQTMAIHRVELLRDGAWQNRLVPDRISLARRESEFEQDLTDGSVTALIVLDDVRVDDVIRISYSTTGSNPILAGQIADWTTLSWRNPTLRSGLRVLYDPGTKFRVHRENTAIEPQVRRGTDAVEVQVQAQALPATVFEDSYPAWYQPYPVVQIAPERSWGEVVAWALPLYPRHTAPFDADLERRLAQWKALPDPQARLTAALRAVQNDVRYFGIEIGDNSHRPNPPDLVWRRRYGDCKDKTYLLATLLNRMGIDAVPALVDTDRGRAIGEFVPSASSFNHVIVRARIGDETVWVDPTIAQQGGDPRRFDLGDYGMALPVAQGVAALEAIARPRDANAGVEVIERFAPSADGREVAFEVETLYTGASADYQRRNTLSERGEELARRYSEYYRKRYGDVETLGEPVIEDDPDRNRLRIRERYLLKSAFGSESGGVRALEVYAEALQTASNLPTALERNGPLGYAPRGRYRHEVEVRLPERWKPTFVAERIDRTSHAFGFQRQVEVGERSVKVVYEMTVERNELPVERVAAHLQELRKVRDELSANLRFAIPASLDAKQREDRLRDLLRDVMQGDGT
jgi:transglutaminase-like putative cysteine protease